MFCSKNLRRQEKQLPPPDLSALDRCRVSYPRSPSAHSNPRAIPACRCCSRSLVEIYGLKCLDRGSKPALGCACSRCLSLPLSRSLALSLSLTLPPSHSLSRALPRTLALSRSLARSLSPSLLPPSLPPWLPPHWAGARSLRGT